MKTPREIELVELAAKVGAQLTAAKLTLAAAESCTGGLLGHLITENAGCSDYFIGSAVVYSYAAKERVLGVDHATLLAEGAVSEAVAQQMAQGARRLFAADIALAVTGIAGPGGGLPNKPVGTVHIHVSAAPLSAGVIGAANGYEEGSYEEGRRFCWDADRAGNKLLSAQAALEMALVYLQCRERSLNGRRSSG